MKILAIRGKNLASLEGEFEINFRIEPLKSAGIFAITGHTGSGKSTILDAMCLALFDKTPRNKDTESLSILDVKDKMVNQNDTRNILRKGTTEGSAEVEFLALDQEEYKATWEVHRAHNHSDGSLGNANMSLINLSTGNHVGDTKTEVKAEISRLLGLSYDQFTRAVLLAQGDFATFLKARSKEKASLLEKLTGTEIYSEISSAIYQKAKETKQTLSNLKDLLENIALLDEDEVKQLEEEKQTLELDLEQLKTTSATLTQKLEWIRVEEKLEHNLNEANQAVQKNAEAIERTQEARQFLTEVSQVQEIKGEYLNRENLQKELKTNQDQLEKDQINLEESTLRYHELTEKYNLQTQKKANLEARLQELKPIFTLARAKDIQLKEKQAQYYKAEAKTKESLSKTQHLTTLLQEKKVLLEQKDQEAKALHSWIDKHKKYESIINSSDLIINKLQDLRSNMKQLEDWEKYEKKTTADLEQTRIKLEAKNLELEQKKHDLPIEIANLRKQLQAGEPCPVCGSKHHELEIFGHQNSSEGLREEDINRAKVELEKHIATLENALDLAKQSLTQVQTQIQSNQKSTLETQAILEQELRPIPTWPKLFKEHTLIDGLKRLKIQWHQKQEELITVNQEFITLSNQIQHLEEDIKEVAQVLEKDKLEAQSILEDKTKIKEDRAKLLEGKPVDTIENQCYETLAHEEKTLKALQLELEKTQQERSKLLGSIDQLKVYIESQRQKLQQQTQTIETWLQESNHLALSDKLPKLMGLDNTWITLERTKFDTLDKQRVSALATRQERQANLSEHQEAIIKPTKEETKEALSQLQHEKEAESTLKVERCTAIIVSLTNNKTNIKHQAALLKKIEQANNINETWQKLNSLLGSADGTKFKIIAQSYTLEALLGYANKHLMMLSNRYRLERIDHSLSLQIIDMDMMDEMRPVHTLSGGESFLISLALALGLSSLSSNRMNVETLFIDEGFGSLDNETLRLAMDALEHLQTQGRKIGIISHVTEIHERIHTQIQVKKCGSGHSKVSTVG